MEKDIINKIKTHFKFLENKFNYNKIEENYSENYHYARIFINKELSQRFSIIYYDKNPLKLEKSKEIAFQFLIFKNDKHIDLSRLLKSNNIFLEFCRYQYFILQYDKKDNNSINNFLDLITEEIVNNYTDILQGKKWIDIDYNLKDDY